LKTINTAIFAKFSRVLWRIFMLTNVQDAAFHTAHDFPGGVAALAQRMGDVSPNVLNKKVDPRLESHHLRLDESVKIQSITGDFRILQAMAFTLNHMVIPLPDMHESGDASLLDDFMEILNAMADFTKEFQKAWADGEVTSKEVELMHARGVEVQARFSVIVARMHEMKID
jgi:hypothetical protein